MSVSTITSKGRITIPIEVRKDIGVDVGDRIEFVRNEETGHYEVIPVTVSIQSLKGILLRRKRPVSIQEMNEAIPPRSKDGGNVPD